MSAFSDNLGSMRATGDVLDSRKLIRHYLRLLRLHWLMFSGVLVGSLLVGGLVLLSLQPKYTATATVAITTPSADPLAAVPQGGEEHLEDDRPATEAAMLQSRDVAASVLRTYPAPAAPAHVGMRDRLCHLGARFLCRHVQPLDPAARFEGDINAFLAGQLVTPELHSRVIDVSVIGPDPARAALLANAMVTNYQRMALERQTADVDRVAQWLDQRTDQLRQRWIDAAHKADDFNVTHKLSNMAGDGADENPLVDRQIQQIAASLGDAQARLAAANARSAALRDASRHGNPRAVVALAQEPILVATANSLMQMQTERDLAAARLGADHPTIRALNEQIAATQARMGAETGGAISSIREDAVSAQAEVSQLEANLDSLRTQEGSQSGPQAVYRTLSQEALSARTVYETFLDRAKAVVDRAALLQPPISFVSHAIAPTAPSFPNHLKMGLGILVVGFALASGAVMLRGHLSRDFHEIDDIRDAVQIPMLGAIPRVAVGRGRSLANYVREEPFSRASEAVRTLAVQLSLMAKRDHVSQTLLVTSAMPQEGKSTLAVWLAAAMRQGGKRVLLIDGDHRRGSLFPANRIGSGKGFTSLFEGSLHPDDVILTDAASGVDYIPPGGAMTRPIGIEDVGRLRELLAVLKKSYSVIIIDSPPLMAMSDGLMHAQVADQTVFVCRWQHSSRPTVMAALDRLRNYANNVSGIVVTMVEQRNVTILGADYSRREQALIERFYGP